MTSIVFRMKIVFILVFFLVTIFCSRDKQVNENKQLREEILAVYQSGGEQGLRHFVRNKKDKISNKFIVDFAKDGVKERKKEWLKVCKIVAKEKKDKKTTADVLAGPWPLPRRSSEAARLARPPQS